MRIIDRLLLAGLRTANRWRFGLTLRRYRDQQGSIAFLEIGRDHPGPTLVFLHGLGASKDQWGRHIYALGLRHHCLFVDLPGHGQSSYEPLNGFGPTSLLGCLGGLLDENCHAQFVLVGSSLGGCAAVLYTAACPDRVKYLVALAPAGLGEETFASAVKLRIESGVPVFGYRTVEEMFNFWRLLFKTPPKTGRLLTRALAANGRARFSMVQKVMNDFKREGLGQLIGYLPMITAPSLFIWGEDDQVFNVETSQLLMSQVPVYSSILISDTGHIPYLERGREVADAIENFISQPLGEGAS
ncbi:MAG: alpha/beta fold hydrolase [Pseudomonas sp.]|uniref:alpha/beta fold hydrolase n=1 Tax=Pseudomonas sp. TaxID=306 RepID=UPI003D6FC28C